MKDCDIRGCRNLETKCKDCGRVVCEKTFKAPSAWINVKDRLPEKDSYHTCQEWLIFCKYVTTATYYAGKWVDNPDSHFPMIYYPTYWMSLPEQPHE